MVCTMAVECKVGVVRGGGMYSRLGVCSELLELSLRGGPRLVGEHLGELIDCGHICGHLTLERELRVRVEAKDLGLLLLEREDLTDERRVLLARARHKGAVERLSHLGGRRMGGVNRCGEKPAGDGGASDLGELGAKESRVSVDAYAPSHSPTLPLSHSLPLSLSPSLPLLRLFHVFATFGDLMNFIAGR